MNRDTYARKLRSDFPRRSRTSLKNGGGASEVVHCDGHDDTRNLGLKEPQQGNYMVNYTGADKILYVRMGRQQCLEVIHAAPLKSKTESSTPPSMRF